jgi:GxxExxY protein
MNIDEITGKIVDACIKIHSTVGPGCFEKVYEEILYFELVKRNLIVDRQVTMPIEYETLHIPDAYRIDLLAE